jgi:hypothetical protein
MPRKPISISVAVGVTHAATVAACGSSTQPSTTGRISNAQAVKYSQCMRAHDVRSFPDPIQGHPGQYPDLSPALLQSPAFKTAQSTCSNLLPSPGGADRASAATRAGLLRSSECMREHGVPNFPDPTSTLPSNPSDYTSIDDLGDVILAIPKTINAQPPAFRQAAVACKVHV